MNRLDGGFWSVKAIFRHRKRNRVPVPLFLMLLVVCCCLCAGIAAQAEEQAGNSPANWEISVKPKPTPAEIEQERWSYVFANDIGIYAFDNKSLKLDEADKRLVYVLVKTTFTDPKVIDSLNEKYKVKLNAGDTVDCSEVQLTFQTKNKTYALPD